MAPEKIDYDKMLELTEHEFYPFQFLYGDHMQFDRNTGKFYGSRELVLQMRNQEADPDFSKMKAAAKRAFLEVDGKRADDATTIQTLSKKNAELEAENTELSNQLQAIRKAMVVLQPVIQQVIAEVQRVWQNIGPLVEKVMNADQQMELPIQSESKSWLERRTRIVRSRNDGLIYKAAQLSCSTFTERQQLLDYLGVKFVQPLAGIRGIEVELVGNDEHPYRVIWRNDEWLGVRRVQEAWYFVIIDPNRIDYDYIMLDSNMLFA